MGILITTKRTSDINVLFESLTSNEFCRQGNLIGTTCKITSGPIEKSICSIAHIHELQLRQLGMPTRLNNGVIELLSDYTICQEGDTLTSNQAALLRVFGEKKAVFR